MMIEPYADSQLDAIVRLSLRAWAPVFESLEAAMLPEVYRAFYRGDRVAGALQRVGGGLLVAAGARLAAVRSG